MTLQEEKNIPSPASLTVTPPRQFLAEPDHKKRPCAPKRLCQVRVRPPVAPDRISGSLRAIPLAIALPTLTAFEAGRFTMLQGAGSLSLIQDPILLPSFPATPRYRFPDSSVPNGRCGQGNDRFCATLRLATGSRTSYFAAYLNSGSILRVSFVPPGSTILLSTRFKLS